MKTVTLTWQVTEEHERTIDVPDDFSPEGADMDAFLTELEGDPQQPSFTVITERLLLGWRVETPVVDLTRTARTPRGGRPLIVPPDPLGGPIPGVNGSVLPDE